MNNGGSTRKRVLVSLFWSYCENIAVQLVSFIVTVLLARLLSPNDYGTIALVIVFINIANVFVNSSFSMSLVQKKDADSLDFNTIFWFNAVISIVLYFLLFIFAPIIAKFYNLPILMDIIRILAIRIPLSSYNSVQTAYVSRNMVFKKSFISTSSGTVLSGVLGIFFAISGFGLWALVVQSISNIVFNTVFLSFIVEWRPQFEFSFDRLKFLVKYGWKLLVTGLMFTGYYELRSLIIGKRYSAEDLAFYNRGFQFPQFIAANIDTTINKVMFPTLSKIQDDLVELRRMTRRAAKTSAYIMTPILFGLAVTAPAVVEILLTNKWIDCVPYIQIMCMIWWLQPTQSCSIQVLKAIGRTDIYLRVEVISKIFGVTTLALSIYIFDTPIAIALTMLLSQAFAFVIYGTYVSRCVSYTIKEQLIDLIIPGMLGFLMGGSVYFVELFLTNKFILVIAQTFVGILVYLGLSYIFGIEEFKYLMLLVRKIGSIKE